ncbi:MAG: hypothetical protein ABSF65_04530 [Candidatus Bathyarchaeia archaeon]
MFKLKSFKKVKTNRIREIMKNNRIVVGIVCADIGVAIVVYAVIQGLLLKQPNYMYLFWIPFTGVVIEVIGLLLFVKYWSRTKRNPSKNTLPF